MGVPWREETRMERCFQSRAQLSRERQRGRKSKEMGCSLYKEGVFFPSLGQRWDVQAVAASVSVSGNVPRPVAAAPMQEG